MAYWLMKSEPDAWSWEQQVAKGAAGEAWSGVRNHQAKLNLMRMKKGERAFFYHSNEGKAVVGTVTIAREHYPDPTAAPGTPWVCVDVVAKTAFKSPVTLDAIRREPALADMVLVNNTRLSVQPVTDEEWAIVCRMGGVKP
ncbi:MAG: EVE domain-containing protein [Hyphomonadaceae bacterium]|nr:EVE domain-containing protein [Hyphomonadaceae bacterium]